MEVVATNAGSATNLASLNAQKQHEAAIICRGQNYSSSRHSPPESSISFPRFQRLQRKGSTNVELAGMIGGPKGIPCLLWTGGFVHLFSDTDRP